VIVLDISFSLVLLDPKLNLTQTITTRIGNKKGFKSGFIELTRFPKANVHEIKSSLKMNDFLPLQYREKVDLCSSLKSLLIYNPCSYRFGCSNFGRFRK